MKNLLVITYLTTDPISEITKLGTFLYKLSNKDMQSDLRLLILEDFKKIPDVKDHLDDLESCKKRGWKSNSFLEVKIDGTIPEKWQIEIEKVFSEFLYKNRGSIYNY